MKRMYIMIREISVVFLNILLQFKIFKKSCIYLFKQLFAIDHLSWFCYIAGSWISRNA